MRAGAMWLAGAVAIVVASAVSGLGSWKVDSIAGARPVSGLDPVARELAPPALLEALRANEREQVERDARMRQRMRDLERRTAEAAAAGVAPPSSFEASLDDDEPIRRPCGRPQDLRGLQAAIAAVLQREGVPGAGIALVEGDRTVWAGGVGLADRERDRPVTADTLFRVGSISKGFLALAFLRLAERGVLDLGARVAELAPELAIGNRWEADSPITIAHLLEHTAGFDDLHPNEWNGPLSVEAMDLAQVLAHNPASRVARWRPGSRFSYANPGYTVAAYVLEKITGRSYERVIQRELLDPLGMDSAALRFTPEVDARLARGYGRGDGAVPYVPIWHRPAGNLMASPRELAALVKLGLGRGRVHGERVVSEADMARFERSETAWLDAGDASYGLGVAGDVSERALIRGHSGGINGFLSMYGYLPDHNVGFVLLVNSTRSGRAVVEIRHLLVEYLLQGAAVRPPPRVDVPEDELRRWAGVYHLAAPRHQLFAFLERTLPGIEVFVESGALYVRLIPGGEARLELIPLGGDRFRLANASASHIHFGRDRDGRRSFVADNAYFAEEPRARTVGFAVGSHVAVVILLTGLALPLLAVLRRRGRRRVAGAGWPFCVAASLVALPRLFWATAEASVGGELNVYTVGIFVLTWVFAVGSLVCAQQALRGLVSPAPIVSRIYRLVFAIASCTATAYLAAYDIIGIRLWSY